MIILLILIVVAGVWAIATINGFKRKEIKIDEGESSRRREAAGAYREVKAESQITDVEFEELK